MPLSAGGIRASLKSDLSRVEVAIPPRTAARIKVLASLSSVTVDETRFPRRGDYYVSPDFETAPNRLDLQVNSSLGSVVVR